jgi:hypothetical protein
LGTPRSSYWFRNLEGTGSFESKTVANYVCYFRQYKSSAAKFIILFLMLILLSPVHEPSIQLHRSDCPYPLTPTTPLKAPKNTAYTWGTARHSPIPTILLKLHCRSLSRRPILHVLPEVRTPRALETLQIASITSVCLACRRSPMRRTRGYNAVPCTAYRVPIR